MAKIDRPARRELHSRAWPGAPGAARPKFAPRRRPRSAYVSARGARVILELLRRRGGRKQSFFTLERRCRPSPVSYRAKARLLVGREGVSVRAEGFGRSVRAPAPPEPFFSVASKLLTRTRSDRVAITDASSRRGATTRPSYSTPSPSGARPRRTTSKPTNLAAKTVNRPNQRPPQSLCDACCCARAPRARRGIPPFPRGARGWLR